MDEKPKSQGFFSALENLENRRKTKTQGCQMGATLRLLSDKERIKLTEILNNTAIPATAIAQVLEDNGYHVHVSTVRYHRQGKTGKGCKCFQTI